MYFAVVQGSPDDPELSVVLSGPHDTFEVAAQAVPDSSDRLIIEWMRVGWLSIWHDVGRTWELVVSAPPQTINRASRVT